MSEYARRMAYLSSRIFGEINKTGVTAQNRRVVRLLAHKPRHKNPHVIDWYPPYQKIDYAFANLRHHGLYRYVMLKESLSIGTSMVYTFTNEPPLANK